MTLNHKDVKDAHRKVWNYEFSAEFTVSIEKDGKLRVSLRIVNGGSKDMPCQALIHTYFRTDVATARILGFGGCTYVDKLRKSAGEAVEKEKITKVEAEIDRIFKGPLASKEIEIRDGQHRRIRIVNSACVDGGKMPIPCDVVFWNPWIAKSKRLSDLNDDGYKYFVCVEPGIVSHVHTVKPGGTLELSQEIACEEGAGEEDADGDVAAVGCDSKF
eukprot:g116.t1